MNEKFDIEISPILESLFQKYGFDFRHYSRAHIHRRILNHMTICGIQNFADLKIKILNDEVFANDIVTDLSITVTEMFRDPYFFVALRENIIPFLKTYSYIKIWHAGCSTGEEAYSMAILLMEEGLYERTTIYATDFNQKSLEQARDGIYLNKYIKEYSGNYYKAGGKRSFSDYYTSQYNMVIMDKSLKKNIVWANHNLVTDSVFAEINLVLCRNVMIYFDKNLQNHVHKLFFDSLINGGILCLGSKESIKFSNYEKSYIELDKKHRIYKKKYGIY